MRKKARKAFKKFKGHGKAVSETMKKYKMIPLPGTFMLTGMVGFMVCFTYTLSGKLNMSWGIAFSLVFALMFFASLLSITPPKHLDY